MITMAMMTMTKTIVMMITINDDDYGDDEGEDYMDINHKTSVSMPCR